MMKKMNYPADYAVLSNEEMTYTTAAAQWMMLPVSPLLPQRS